MAHPTTVFYVYAETDEKLRQELEKHLALLQRLGMLASWQPVLAGALWEQEREQAFQEASLILLLVSADFLASDVCYKEQMQRALERQKEGEVQVLPILVRPVEVTNAPFTHLPMVPTNGQAATLWSNQDAAWKHITEGIRCVLDDKPLPVIQEKTETAGYTTENQQAVYGQTIGEHNVIHHHYPPLPVSTPPEAKPIWMVPYARNPFFTGRDEVLDDLHQRFQRGQAQAVSQPQAISGLGGIGKTQIAVEYACRYREDYQQVLWASAETEELLTVAYTKIATTLDLPEKGEKEQEVIVEAVKQWLAEHKQWLLILDNADEPEVLEPFLPPVVGGYVLVTTRASNLTTLGLGFGHGLEIETFTAEQGALFLLHRAGLLALDVIMDQTKGEDRQHAMELSEELGGLPLVLDQAGAYIAQIHCTIESYQQLYQTHRRQLLKERRGKKEHPDPVATTWKLSFERVEAANAAAAELLRLCSFLAPDVIPEWMLTKGAEQLGSLLAPVVIDAYLLDQAVEAPQAYSLLRRDANRGMLRVHRLVQTVLRDAMTEEEETAWKQRVLLFLEEACPDVSKVEQWPECEQWVANALVSATWLEQAAVQTEAVAFVCNEAGYYLSERGSYVLAKPLCMRALEIREKELGPTHPDTASSLNNLALLYYTQGKYSEAEPLMKRALAIREQELGPGHPDTAMSLNNLAELYQAQGKYEQAEPLHKRALAIREQELGPTHPSTATSLNNLALLYNAQGKYSEAEPSLVRALAIWEQELGPRHPETARSLNNLAALYKTQGKSSEAEPLYQRALAICEQELGPMHPETARSLNNLAELYRAQGKYSEAAPLYERALAIREQKLGPRHPDTASSLNNLAALYWAQGNYALAESLHVRALAINEQALGPRHPNTARSLNDLAALYNDQGKYAEAEPLLKRALAICEEELGLSHPDTAASVNNLAMHYEDQGKYGEAEPLLERALAIREQKLGPTHPDTATSVNNLAALYYEQEKYMEAEPLLVRALEISKQELGPSHPDTAGSLNNLAILYYAQRKYSEAEPLVKQALKIWEQSLGAEHPNAKQVRKNYAGVLRALGREEEAAALEAEGDEGM